LPARLPEKRPPTTRRERSEGNPMAKLRFVQDPKKLEQALEARRTSRKASDSQMMRVFYETHPEIVAALLPRPLKPAARPEVMLQFSHIVMRPSPGVEIPCANATVAVAATYEGREGWYVLMMPMEGEWVVITGRERYGEPKKLADVTFDQADGKARATVTRLGVTFLEAEGVLAEAIEPRAWTEHLFCYKAMPNIDSMYGFDGDVFLSQLNWEREWKSGARLKDLKVTLRESAADPLVDVPVVRITGGVYARGTAITGGELLQKVPGEWLQPFWFARLDDNPTGGIEIELAAERLVEA
jgi:acetoacetate decarboxylase